MILQTSYSYAFKRCVEVLLQTNVNFRTFPTTLEARQDSVTVRSSTWQLDNLHKKLSGNQYEQHEINFGWSA